MTHNKTTKMTLAFGAAAAVAAQAVAQTDSPLDNAFNALQTYDWGADRNLLNPIDQAVIATQTDSAARKTLEKRLVDALAGGLSRSAQDYVCRRLRVIGTAQSVDALATLLPAEETSHIARFALERIADEKAGQALRDALPKVNAKLKAGVIGSLGVRRDAKSVDTIAKFLDDADTMTAQAAAHSLGLIGTPAAAKALSQFAAKAPAAMAIPVADARLLCAEQLLADGNKAEAMALYKELQGDSQPSHVRVAAMRGLVSTGAKK
ncbi:MAG TPA: HEAT repeat domain-containing protein [Sedimentisphaerales bacterium]|nr:HEAT repeat domain-containing protein [Sedimentisphaerales bacterium]HQG48943.1 HEAT repeat domain-containing protein [Sedimentisphaerales bacterium]HQI27425.1 HEAT repeat domain-containing protein [Sedimentisphaerales bacterium]